MEDYYISAKELYQILYDKGIRNLYHANTVATSLTFIKNNALLSRGYVEENGLVQTYQNSDNEDKAYGVWNDIFLDGFDLHDKYRRANKYGPILFVLKLELLLSEDLQNVLITKTNPWYWKNVPKVQDRYYDSLEEVKRDYLSGKKLDSRVMFTFRNSDNYIILNNYLEFIGIDKPTILINLQSGGEKNVGDYAYNVIEQEMQRNGLGHIPIRHRHPKGINFCSCNFNYTWLYNRDYSEFEKRFKAIK